MCSEHADLTTLQQEFETVAKELNACLDDLKWRVPDVEAEERELKRRQRLARKDPGVDVATQATVTRVLRAVLDDKLAEADRLTKRLEELKAGIIKAEREAATEKGESESGETIRKAEE